MGRSETEIHPDAETTGVNIAVIGSGYVGTTLAASLAELGHHVTAVDIDEDVVRQLNAGDAPVHEDGLDDLVAEHAGDRLHATTTYDEIADVDVVFVAVQTPSRADGGIDVSALRSATLAAVETLIDGSTHPEGHVLVIKSTVTPPQLSTLKEDVRDLTAASDVRVELATNPEFLREGSAVDDFRTPDKIVFGVGSEWAGRRLMEVFERVIEEADPAVITTDPETAVMIKYANNAFLAAKISLINDLGNISKEFGIDAYEVAEAIGTDERIGARFLRSGVGFGGSCFPKDVKALVSAASDAGYEPELLHAALAVNETQPERMLALLERHVDPTDQRIAVLGLAFKPGTDDTRSSRAIPVIEGLQSRGANVVAYDPVADLHERFPGVEHAESAEAALEAADAVLILTAWPEFAELGDAFTTMATPVVIDGRRIVEPTDDIIYEGLTW